MTINELVQKLIFRCPEDVFGDAIIIMRALEEGFTTKEMLALRDLSLVDLDVWSLPIKPLNG
jgi:hypothetical protein